MAIIETVERSAAVYLARSARSILVLLLVNEVLCAIDFNDEFIVKQVVDIIFGGTLYRMHMFIVNDRIPPLLQLFLVRKFIKACVLYNRRPKNRFIINVDGVLAFDVLTEVLR